MYGTIQQQHLYLSQELVHPHTHVPTLANGSRRRQESERLH